MVYSPLNGETIYDIAKKLYNDIVSGVSDILLLNPTINIDADLFGVPITYRTLPKRVLPVVIHPPTPTIQEIYLTRDAQSVYDLSIQLYGTVSNIGKLLEKFPNLNNMVPFNSPVDIVDESDPVVLFFKTKVVSTFRPPVISDDFRITNLGRRIINTGAYRKVIV
jgi:hypothetical protein